MTETTRDITVTSWAHPWIDEEGRVVMAIRGVDKHEPEVPGVGRPLHTVRLVLTGCADLIAHELLGASIDQREAAAERHDEAWSEVRNLVEEYDSIEEFDSTMDAVDLLTALMQAIHQAL